MTGFLCSGGLYEFEGITIEIPFTGGPWPLKDDGSPYQRLSLGMITNLNRFCALSDKEREEYRVGGGCRGVR